MLKTAIVIVLFAVVSALPQASKDEKATGSCQLPADASVQYTCLTDGKVQDCKDTVPDGAAVIPNCRAPNYYAPSYLPNMRCSNGKWDYIAKCIPECGRITPKGQSLILDGKTMHGEVPWHAGIYAKKFMPYKLICGGSLVSTKTVISAAHCFWNDIDGKQSPKDYAVAVGKIYRPWGDAHDAQAQFSDVSQINIAVQFRGVATNFQSDIAILELETEIQYNTFIRPVCMDFNTLFDNKQLQAGNLGMIALWAQASAGDKQSNVLKVEGMPFMPYDQCYTELPEHFREFMTADKICAGFRNGTSICPGGGGSGLAFPEQERGIVRYYLRGVASVAQRSEDSLCAADQRILFTQLVKHELFIKQYVQ